MKMFKWQKYLTEQRELYGKTLFTVTELSHAADISPKSLNVNLFRLRKHGLIERYVRGKYGLPGIVNIRELVECIDSGAYITTMFALNLHGLVPTSITCFTNRRHNRSRKRNTALGRLLFVCVRKPVYSLPEDGNIASPEQAFFDFIYLCRRTGSNPQSQVTFYNLGRLKMSEINRISSRYPASVRKQAELILHASSC